MREALNLAVRAVRTFAAASALLALAPAARAQAVTVQINATWDGRSITIPDPSFAYVPPGAQVKLAVNLINGFTGSIDELELRYVGFAPTLPNETTPTVNAWISPLSFTLVAGQGGQFLDQSSTAPYVATLTLPTAPPGNYLFTIINRPTLNTSPSDPQRADFFLQTQSAATFLGEWTSIYAYPRGAIVTYNSNTYVRQPSIQPTGIPQGNAPPGTDLTQWQPIGGVGPQGPTGPQGVAGPIGPTGADGTQGPQGLQGVPGAQGVAGLQGPTGAAGLDGAPGPAGDIGPTGPTGAPGPIGPAGPRAFPMLAIASSLTVDPTAAQNCFLVDASGAARTISLPPAASVENGRIYVVKKLDTNTKHAVTVNVQAGGLIEGAASVSITATLRALQFGSDGTRWWVISTQ